MRLRLALLAGTALCVVCGLASAVPTQVVVTFDDIDASAGDVGLTAPYAGLDWSNFFAYTRLTGLDGFNAGIVSPSNAAYGAGEFGIPSEPVVSGIVAPVGTFDLVSASFGSGYYDNLSLTLTGMRSHIPLFSRTLNLDTNGARAFTFDFTGIDQLTFSAVRTDISTDPFFCGTNNCTQFTIDDLSLVLDTGAPVPELGTFVLMLAGLSGLGFWRRFTRL